jgi:hypothetical protein
MHGDNSRLAATSEAIFFLAPADRPGASQLLAAPVDARGVIGRWHVLPLPRRIYAPRHLWIEPIHRSRSVTEYGEYQLLMIAAKDDRYGMYGSKIEAGYKIQGWKHVVDLPLGTWPEAAAMLGDRCLIASRSGETGRIELLVVSVKRTRILSRLGSLDDVRGEASLVSSSDSVILVDGGDWPGRAQIRVAKLSSDGGLSPWVSRSAGYHGVLSSLCGVVVGDTILVAGRNTSGHCRHAPISSYATRLALAS